MNTQKAPTSTAASPPPPPPKPSNGARKPQAPFTPPSRDNAGVEPTEEPTDALSLLSKWVGTAPTTAAPSTACAVQRPPPPAPSDDSTRGPLPHAGDLLAETPETRARPKTHDDPLDPMLRQAAQLSPPLATPPASLPTTPDAAVTVRAMASLEELLPQLVRKIAWSGDGKRGSVRLELGAGALAGSTLMLESEAGRVRVQMDTPPGVDGEAWKSRIGARLAEKGIDVESFDVR